MWIIIILAAALIHPVPSLARGLNSLDLIEKAYRNGKMDYQEALNYKVTAVYRQESLPESYRSRVPVKSATPIMMEAVSNRRLLNPENARILGRGRTYALTELYGSGIRLQSFMSQDRNFRIHYTIDNKYGDAVPISDINRNNVPDYVEIFSDILDNVWSSQIVEMGYDAPPSDGTEGGDCLLDVYLADINAYGYTSIDLGMPASSVYMILENDYSAVSPNFNPGGQVEGAIKVSAAHEFFHAIQFQISDDIELNGWWMEASATWMEDRIYPEVKDYVNYISDWFQDSDLPLDTYNAWFQYGTSVWVKHMTEKYGSEFVYDVWNRIKAGDAGLSGIENELTGRGTTLAEELKEMRVSNITFTFNDSMIYQTWDTVNPEIDPIAVGYDAAYTEFSTTETININNSVNRLASRYYSFSAPSGSGTLNIAFNGEDDVSGLSLMVIGFRSGDTEYDVSEVLIDEFNDGSVTVNGFSSEGPYTRVIVIPVNHSTADSGDFSLTASYSTSTLPAGDTEIEIRPSLSSIVTGDAGIIGRQQYFLIQKDETGSQVLESGTDWSTELPSSAVVVNGNGFIIALSPGTGKVTASLDGISSNSATLSSRSPATFLPGASRNCPISNSDAGCFIATAAFGSLLHPYVSILREFRDTYMLTNSIGRRIVSLYYIYSPPLAEKIEKDNRLRATVKIGLFPVIILSGFMVKTTLAEKIIAGLLMIMIIMIIKGRRSLEN